MPFGLVGGVLGGIGSIFGASKQAAATRDAANIQAGAANNATQLQRDEFNQVQQNEAPYKAVGDQAASWLQDHTFDYTFGQSANFNPTAAGLPSQFSYNPTDFENDPAFQSSMKFGQQALERSAASKGGLLGGAEQKSLMQFGTDTANQYYNQDYSRALGTYQQNYSNAFNTFNSNRDSSFNKLSSLAGMGQNAAAGSNAAGANFANNAGEYALQSGNAQAAGVVGGANAFANGMGGVTANAQNLLNNPQVASYLKNAFSGGGQSSYGSISTDDRTSNAG